MLKTHLSWFISLLVLLGAFSQPVAAQQTASMDQVKIKVARLGVGEKAKATIRLNDGAKIKGYIAQAAEDNFVIRDRKTDTPTTIRYADVAKVESNRGHSTARNIALGVGIGVGTLLAVVAIAFAHLD